MLQARAHDAGSVTRAGMPITGVLILFLIGLLAGEPPSRTQTPRDGHHRTPAEPMSFRGAPWLEREGRNAEERPDEVLEIMNLQPGDVAADIGCGSGYFARRMARRVAPGGKVYGVDIQPEMLKLLTQLAEKEGVVGVEPVLGAVDDPKLPASEIDWIILADVYHELSHPEKMLEKMRQSLSPTGRVALLEYRAEDGSGDHIKSDHAMSVRQVLAEWKPAGFELVDLHEFLPSQHLFIFRATALGGAKSGPARDRVEDLGLAAALEGGLVEARAMGAGAEDVVIKIRRRQEKRLIVTLPAGTLFVSGGEVQDMVSRRDGVIRLFGDGWHEWKVRAVGRQLGRPNPSASDRLDLRSGSRQTELGRLMQAIQAGIYSAGEASRLYAPRTHEVEQAAIWIVDGDPRLAAIEPRVGGARVPAKYAVAFALVFCDRAGIDIARRQIWQDRNEIFTGLRDQGLNRWYELKTLAGR